VIVQPAAPDEMVDIFRRSEFDRTPGWWSRTWSAIGDAFGNLSFSWLGPVGQFVLWLLLVAAVVALVVWLRRRWLARRRRADEEDDVDAGEVALDVDASTDPEALRDTRRRSEAQRDYKQAVLFSYRALVVTVMRAGLAPNVPGRTTGELRRDVADAVPAVDADFDAATTIFEVAWFSDHSSTPADLDRLDALAAAVLRGCGAPGVATDPAATP